jgi:hypothetical protein
MAEQMHDAGLPWVAIDPKGDWWGIRSSGDGKGPGLPVLVLGGQHGDVPLEPTAGRLVADLIVEQRLTAVVDVSLMSKADMRRFLADFAERLYQRNTEPLHVFAEEAHEYIPQRVTAGDARMVGAWEKLVKWGRTHGLGVTLITQRSASLNKDVLTQVETLIALRTTGPQDQAAVRPWVDEHDSGAAMMAELRKLPTVRRSCCPRSGSSSTSRCGSRSPGAAPSTPAPPRRRGRSAPPRARSPRSTSPRSRRRWPRPSRRPRPTTRRRCARGSATSSSSSPAAVDSSSSCVSSCSASRPPPSVEVMPTG